MKTLKFKRLVFFLEPQIDEAVVLELASMGFPIEGCKKAVYFTKNTGI